MENVRKTISQSLDLIKKKWIHNKTKVNFWIGLDVEIILLHQIAIRELKSDDELLKEIHNTRKIICQS